MAPRASLTADKALIFRVTHRDNLPWLLDNGLWSANSGVLDPDFVTIGRPELIERRPSKGVPIPPGGTLSDYIPFYFTPYSPMLYQIVTGMGVRQWPREELVVLVSSLHDLSRLGCEFVFTDRHAFLAYLTGDNFSSELDDLGHMIPWELLQARDFQHDPDQPDKKECYQAEALVHRHMPVSALKGVVAYNDEVASWVRGLVAERELGLPVYADARWFFG